MNPDGTTDHGDWRGRSIGRELSVVPCAMSAIGDHRIAQWPAALEFTIHRAALLRKLGNGIERLDAR